MALAEVKQAKGRVPVTVFQLQERIHLGNFAELENLVKDVYESGTRNLVIDLSQTDTITSIGLRSLVVVHKILAKSDNRNHLRIAGATTVMREIMQVTGISQFIEVYDKVEEAVASFQGNDKL